MRSGGQRAAEIQFMIAPAHLAARQQVLEAQIAHAGGNQLAADHLAFDARLANVGRINFAPPPTMTRAMPMWPPLGVGR